MSSAPCSATICVIIAFAFARSDALASSARPRLTRLRGGTRNLLPAAAVGLLFAATPASAAKAPELIHCVGAASGFFGNVRVPAALLAGASLGQLFAKPDESRGKWLPTAFSYLMALTVMSEIYCVFTATATATRLMGGGFNPMATDAMAFLIREFEYEFVSTRVSFFGGLLFFLSALMLRAWAAFPGALGSCIAFAMLSVTLQMISFFNATVLNYNFGLAGLIYRCLTLYLTRSLTSAFGFASLVTAGAALLMFCKCANEKMKKA